MVLQRLDLALVERGLAETRERAQALIAAGLVEVGGRPARSAAQRIAEDAAPRLIGQATPWASRAGEKLDAALEEFGVDCLGRVCLDAGASTGGFTDVLLTRGAARVYAVDVGHGQLLPRLAEEPRVTVLDRTNLRHLEAVPGPTPTLVTLDLSFISLRLVLPRVARVAPGAEVIALFKPQFELGRAAVGKGGVVRDPAAALAGARALLGWCAEQGAEALGGPIPAALRGTKGNLELFLHLRLPDLWRHST
ncbi:MAG TPA: TlyA family RNA methyltransferase [Candidatus Binatia bacterium]|nr:TlyA family RNA methyltransferase [Candidatus Binatia bacterium]